MVTCKDILSWILTIIKLNDCNELDLIISSLYYIIFFFFFNNRFYLYWIFMFTGNKLCQFTDCIFNKHLPNTWRGESWPYYHLECWWCNVGIATMFGWYQLAGKFFYLTSFYRITIYFFYLHFSFLMDISNYYILIIQKSQLKFLVWISGYKFCIL